MQMRSIVLCVCALVLTASAALAQFDTAAVVGTVRDASGAVVPGAKVTLTATETGISIVRTSSSDGNYEFAAVKPGRYVVTAEGGTTARWTTSGWSRSPRSRPADCGQLTEQVG